MTEKLLTGTLSLNTNTKSSKNIDEILGRKCDITLAGLSLESKFPSVPQQWGQNMALRPGSPRLLGLQIIDTELEQVPAGAGIPPAGAIS